MPILGLSSTYTKNKPDHFDIEKIIRPNILSLHPYRCARDDYSEGILLDANENALGHSIPRNENSSVADLQDGILEADLHRYPSPTHDDIKARIASLRGLSTPNDPKTSQIFLGVGSDEIIDLLIRVFVQPAQEKILICPPTYGMYKVCAQINDVSVVTIPLELTGLHGEGGKDGRFSLVLDDVKTALFNDPTIKLVFLCSPGNPTGTTLDVGEVRKLLEFDGFKGIVVVDEAYIDFAGDESSAVSLAKEYDNIVVMQTLSKGFGLAAIRMGIAIAQPPIIQILTNTKAPYNISTPTAHLALSALTSDALSGMRKKIETLISEREKLIASLAKLAPLGVGRPIGGNNANFVLIPILEGPPPSGDQADSARAEKVYKMLAEEQRVVVRFRGNEMGCAGCLRITVGSEEENKVLLEKLEEMLKRFGKDGKALGG
jgi:histidinol-phosphate aminotransferase